MTVRGMGSGPTAKPLLNLARYTAVLLAEDTCIFSPPRALEGSFRSLNNLLERLHHSEFFYYAPSRGRFISIGLFMPPLGLLLAPLMLEISFSIIVYSGEHLNTCSYLSTALS